MKQKLKYQVLFRNRKINGLNENILIVLERGITRLFIMISLNKLLRNSFFLTALIGIFFFGCKKEPETKKFIARVNDAYLTEEDISELDSLFGRGFSRSEVIKKWIEKELLYQEAMKAGIADKDEFNRIINNSRRELASSMLLNLYLENNLKKPSNTELQEFYNVHKSEFQTEDNIYVFNSASLSKKMPINIRLLIYYKFIGEEVIRHSKLFLMKLKQDILQINESKFLISTLRNFFQTTRLKSNKNK